MIDGFFFRRPRGPFTAEVVAAAIRHANAEAPYESVGLVVDGDYRRVRNIAPDPEHAFEIADADMLAALCGGELQGRDPFAPRRAVAPL